MADAFNQSNFKPDQGRGFISSLLSKLPYADIVQEVDDNNPKYELFHRLTKNREMKIMKQSVITGPHLNNEWNDRLASGFDSDKGYHQYIYAKLDTDKARRLSEYRRMAAFAEVSDCLDEICDDFINKDDNGNVITLQWNNFSKLEPEEKAEIEKEFYKFIKIYELEKNGWSYCRNWLTEGEIFWENVVHSEKKDLGIVGALRIPGELINPVYDNIQNTVIENFLFQKPIDISNNNANQYPPSMKNTNPVNSLQQQILTLEGKQVTYVHSNIWNEDFTIRVPFIENCRRAYKQVSLLEDSIVIYRLVRAPERLKFKIDVGNMPPAKAEAVMKQMMQAYRSRKTFDGSSTNPGAGNIYEPLSMLDDFWFAKRAGETGSDVELMQGGGNISEIADLIYFVKKLYKSLKVPETRINPEQSFSDGAQILREELRFAKFILRIQHHFAQGFKQSFVTHLKLRNWWKDYNIHESYFDLEFTPPSSYFAVRQQQLFELKYNNFNNMSQNDSMSKTYCQRHYLGLSDEKISENMEWKRKDEALKWELAQIQQFGPNWREHMEAMSEAGEQLSGGAEIGDGSSGLGGGLPSPSDMTGTNPQEIPQFGGESNAEEPEPKQSTPETNQPQS
jgi:hypothetical protein